MKRIVPLMSFVPRIMPGYGEPRHLAPIVDFFERAHRGEEVRAVASIGPGFGKTDTISCGIAWELKQDPRLRYCYVSHGGRAATRKSGRILTIAGRALVPLDKKHQSASDWRTGRGDGGCYSTSHGGAVIGERFDRIVIDDIVKDRVTVESLLARERLWEYVNDVLLTRLEPGGSVLQCMHRWHEDDLSGRLLATGEWQEICLPAINEQGESLWPERFPIKSLRKTEATMGPYAFQGLYQGKPMPRGGLLFRDVVHYTTAPDAMRIVVGVDLSYSEKTKRDRSAAVVLGFAGEHVYVLHVVCEQAAAPAFCTTLLGLKERYPGAPFVMYVGGTEIGVLDLFREKGLHIEAMQANVAGDKFTRAQATSAAWNSGEILVLSTAPWAEPYISEVCGFTGAKGGRDDQVDATVAAFDRGRARTTEANFKCPPPVFLAAEGAGFESVEQPMTITGPTSGPFASPPANAGQAADRLMWSILQNDANQNGGGIDGF